LAFFLNKNIVRFGVRTKGTKKKQEEFAFYFCPKLLCFKKDNTPFNAVKQVAKTKLFFVLSFFSFKILLLFFFATFSQ